MTNQHPYSGKRPNVIWIFGDQHRAQALGCNGDPSVRTPNIDMLAASGVQFTNAISGYPLCCPFRGSLLTSRYPHKCVPRHQAQLPPEQKTIAHAFHENGYKTAYIGKWHLDGFEKRTGGPPTISFRPNSEAGSSTGSGMKTTTAPGIPGFMAVRERMRFIIGCPASRRMP